MKNAKILAIIPARSGSKGLPGKNIKLFAGKPLIEWTIQAAKNTQAVDFIFVSTDSTEIAEISKKAGASCSFLRSQELSSDSASTIDVIFDTVEQLKKLENLEFTHVLLLQPTSPLRTSKHIDEAIHQYFSQSNSESEKLISVKKIDSKYFWSMRKNENGFVEFLFNQDPKNPARQNLKELFLPNGAIYISPIANLADTFFTKTTQYYVMPEEISIDIDTIEEFESAEQVFKKLLSN